MSFFGGFRFFLFLIIILIPAVVMGVREKSLSIYRLASSLLMICLVMGHDKRQLLFLAAFYLIELNAVKLYLLLRKKYGRNPAIYGHFVMLSILPLVLCKLSGLFSFNLFQFLGISYITFRVVQIIIEGYDGLIEEIDTFEFTGFILFFPTFSSGPIDRSRRFSEDWNRIYTREEYLELLGEGLQKILIGFIYKFILAAAFYHFVGMTQTSLSILMKVLYSYSYGFYLFFDFAGYSLMAIGASYILGVRTPENFNKPLISKDMKDFWNRWHMSLSYWFRDFIFSRFMMKSIREKWFSSRLNGAAAGFIVNMLIMGVWHGVTVYYILYGLYHGILLALTEIYQKKSKFYAVNKNKKWYWAVSWFLTLNLVMFGFFIFSGNFTQWCFEVLKRVML
ncbi:MAG: D-alanyl-lipoteichoic acid biosynthesis protein DltB [Massilibacteroides sp.]|nr:D-alanyl-lipoteichoic acid biosynthesis protein DltB [Massilibacteroides sp.]